MEVRQKVFKMHTYDLSKKVALITGAGGLLGIQHAIALFEVNANVVLTDINIKALKKQKAIIEKKFNKNCLIYKLDVTNKSSIQKVIKDLTKKNIFVYLSLLGGISLGFIRIIAGGHFISDIIFAQITL